MNCIGICSAYKYITITKGEKDLKWLRQQVGDDPKQIDHQWTFGFEITSTISYFKDLSKTIKIKSAKLTNLQISCGTFLC